MGITKEKVQKRWIWQGIAMTAVFFCCILWNAVKPQAKEATYIEIQADDSVDQTNFVKIKCGQTADLTAVLLPAGSTTSSTLTWKSSNTDSVVFKGTGTGLTATVKGKTAGNATISVSNGAGLSTNSNGEATVQVVHDWGKNPKYEVIQEPTPDQDGIQILRCVVCGKEVGRSTIKYRPPQTGKETEKQTEKSTEKQTEKPAKEPTVKPTEKQTEEQVEIETEFSSEDVEEEFDYVELNVYSLKMQKKTSSTALKVVDIGEGDRVTSWTSSKPDVVAVNQKTGKLTAKKVGKAIIKVKTKNGVSAACKVTVQSGKVKTTKLKFSQKSITLKVGKTMNLSLDRRPPTANDKLTYKSSDTKKVAVNAKGKIRAKKKGTAKITVRSASGKTATVTIKVK